MIDPHSPFAAAVAELEDTCPTPADLVRKLSPLNEAVEPLLHLIETNPRLTRSVIELGMVMAVHAWLQYMSQRAEFMSTPLTAQGFTYGDLIRSEWGGLR